MNIVNKKIPSLDGLRALSILLVLFDHGSHSLPAYIKDNFLYAILSNSDLGVRIFFVISGYLITRLLLEEQQKSGEINLKKFYIKRILRIFPVFYLYIAVIVLLQVFGIHAFNWRDILIASLFLWNMRLLILGNSSDVTTGPRNENSLYLLGHFWTLAMEEQFYLVWPFVMKLVKAREKLVRICIVVILIMPLVRIVFYFALPAVRGQINNMIFTSCDSLLVGCLVSLLEKSAYRDKMIRLLTRPMVVLLSVLTIFIASPYLLEKYKGTYNLTVGMSITNIGIASLIIYSIYVDNAWKRLLNLKAVATVGVLSYSIYIWQQLFMTNVTWMAIDIKGYRLNLYEFPQNIIAVIIVSSVSYYLYEKKFLKLKSRIKA